MLFKVICRYLTTVVAVGVLLLAARSYALDFYGADVFDSDVPSIYFKVGLFGVKPIVNSVAFDSTAEKLGLRRGNIILSINGIDVNTTSELSQFTTNVLSVLVVSGFEAKVLYLDRLAFEPATSKSASVAKKTGNKGKLLQDVSATAINDPSTIANNRTSTFDSKKTTTAGTPPPQTSLEVLTRLNQAAGSTSQLQPNKEKQDRVPRETPETSSKLENNKASEKPIVITPVAPQVVMPKTDIISTPPKPVYDRVISTPANSTPQQTSLEILTRLNQTAELPLRPQSSTKKQNRRISEPPETPSKPEDMLIPEKTTSVPAVAPQTVAPKSDIFSIPIKPAYDRIIFENDKGNVSFRHSSHLKKLSKEQCMLCHRTSTPTLGSIQSRLSDNRTAHSLCRGCHQKMGNAPTTECYQCHGNRNKN